MITVVCPLCKQKAQVLEGGSATCRGEGNKHEVRVMVTRDKLPKEGK